jgi:predicted O-linked N-acetylglucosamine transferase (SPINDLY family)
MFDVCTVGDTACINMILKFLPHTSTDVTTRVARTSLVVKKNFFSFPVAVNNSIKVGPLVFLLYIFVITGNIMKRPV